MASLISSAASVQDVPEPSKAPRNSDRLELVKFPRPSFKRTATGVFDHADVTITSGKLSPFTSREVICSPPVGAVMATLLLGPPLNRNAIQYSVRRELIWPASTLAKSGRLSPSKSAIAKRIAACAGEAAAAPRLANTSSKQRAAKSHTTAFPTNFWRSRTVIKVDVTNPGINLPTRALDQFTDAVVRIPSAAPAPQGDAQDLKRMCASD